MGMVPFWTILVAFAMGALFLALGVGLGAYAVYRTKREAHEPFLRLRQPQGAAWNEDEYMIPGQDIAPPPQPPSMSNEFTKQFMADTANLFGQENYTEEEAEVDDAA